jgi:Fe-S-cluster-containing hydrogenase component 2
MKVRRKIVEIDGELCDGCGLCVPACAEGAIEIVGGKATLVAEKYCDGLGACLGECPKGALRVVEREAEEFDEEAVEEHLKVQKASHPCPSSTIEIYQVENSRHASSEAARTPSALTHWPVQIRLVPPTAPFLQGAHLLVMADCCPVAYPEVHRDFIQGRAVLVGCPKFDEIGLYMERFKEIFQRADVKSVLVLTMEVPCCNGLPALVRRAMDLAGKKVPLEHVVVSTRGDILRRARLVS